MHEFAAWLQGTQLSLTIQSVPWIIPLLQSIHIITIGIVFVSVLMVALRVLGWIRKDESIEEVLRRFTPWFWCGLVVMTLTGATLVIGEPRREFINVSFWVKMSLLAVGAISAFAFRRMLGSARFAGMGLGEAFSPAAKSAAVGTVVLWLAIIFLGRAIAYDIEVWGPLSPFQRT